MNRCRKKWQIDEQTLNLILYIGIIATSLIKKNLI